MRKKFIIESSNRGYKKLIVITGKGLRKYIIFEGNNIYNLTKNQVKYSNWIGNENQVQIIKDGYKQIFFQDPQGYWLEINNIN